MRGEPPRFFPGVAAAWSGVWSQLGNSAVAMTADGLEDIAHVRKLRQAFEDLEAEINIGLSKGSSVRSFTKDSCS
jgi:hypothetical protein